MAGWVVRGGCPNGWVMAVPRWVSLSSRPIQRQGNVSMAVRGGCPNGWVPNGWVMAVPEEVGVPMRAASLRGGNVSMAVP